MKSFFFWLLCMPLNPKLAEVISFTKSVVVIVVIVILIRGSLVEPFKIPSESMVPTLKITDHILVSKLSYGLRLPFVTDTLWQYSTPKRGDIVVFTRPDERQTPLEDESAINIIKRVVGLPGETVEVKGTTVLINGAVLNEPYARWIDGGSPGGNFGPAVVPENSVLLLGDNRDRSRDSRYWEYHFLEISRIKGRALLIYFTLSDFLSRVGTILR